MQLGGLYLWSSGGFGAVHRHFVCELYFTDKMSVNASDQEEQILLITTRPHLRFIALALHLHSTTKQQMTVSTFSEALMMAI